MSGTNLDKEAMNSIQPLLSVSAVIALYNGEEHIIDAIESILAQTVQVQEIIIVDDGSSDNSSQVIDDYLAESQSACSIVKKFSQPNKGQGSARNKGVAEATGELIGFLDQDDTWEPTHIAEMVSNFTNRPTLGWVYTDFNEIDESTRYIRRQFLAKHKYIPPQNSLFSLISQDLMMLPSASLIRRKALIAVNGFDSQFRGYEDDDLFIRLFVDGWDFQYIPSGLVNYRIHQNNSSRNLSFPQSRMKFYRKYKNFFDRDSEYFHKFFFNHLAPRIISSNIQDAAIAARSHNEPARKFASDSLKEIFEDTGHNFKSRIALTASKHPFTLRVALYFRSIMKKPQKSSKITY